jgi:hypothetical protein
MLASIVALLAVPGYSSPPQLTTKTADATKPDVTPTITLPEKLQGNYFVVIRANTNGKVVKWMVLDPGADLLPSDVVANPLACVLIGAPGVYRVRAYTALGDTPSDWAECVATIGTPVPPQPPPVPTGVTALAGDRVVNLSWIARCDRDCTCSIYRGTVSGGETLLVKGLTVSVYMDTAVVNGTKYFYQITCTNVNGESQRSVEVNATPGAPGPQPGPAPIPVAGYRVLMVYESATLANIPAAQREIFFDKSVRDYLRATCVKGIDNITPEWRVWDTNSDTINEPKLWQDAMKRERKSLPWILVSNGTTGFEGPLPGTVAETLTLLKQFAQ